MISIEEYFMGRANIQNISRDLLVNTSVLVTKLNIMLMRVSKDIPNFKDRLNDGYRGTQQTYGAASSAHRICLAGDIDDDEAGTLWKWTLANLYFVSAIGLWMEHPGYTHYTDKDGSKKSWMHYQAVSPGSGRRIYIPSSSPNPNPGFWNGIYDTSLDRIMTIPYL